MPWFRRKSYNLVKAQSNKTNSKTEPILKRDSRLRSTLTYRFSSYFKKSKK